MVRSLFNFILYANRAHCKYYTSIYQAKNKDANFPKKTHFFINKKKYCNKVTSNYKAFIFFYRRSVSVKFYIQFILINPFAGRTSVNYKLT